MALLFLDSFDHTLNAADKYLSGGTAFVTGRHGNGYQGALRCALNPTHGRCVVGAAFRFATTFAEVVRLYDVRASICTVSTQHDGAMQVQMFGGPITRSASDLIRLNQWHYLEVDFTVTVTPTGLGTFVYAIPTGQVLLDGAVVINADLGSTPAQDPPVSAAGWAVLDILATTIANAAIVDDLYIGDGSGLAPHNAPLGDVQIDVIRPDGVGAATAWTPTGAAANWDAVNDPTPDGDTTRVTAASAGLDDLYTLVNVSTGDTILGAQLLISARRTEEGAAVLAPLLRHAGTTTALTARALSTSYFYRTRDVFVTMPNGDPLTDAHVNALQAGLRRTV